MMIYLAKNGWEILDGVEIGSSMEELFLEGEFYKHKGFKDVCVKILKFINKDEKGLYFNIEYWNLGCMGKPWLLGRSYGFLIRYNDIENWDLLEEEDLLAERPKSYFFDL